VDSITEKDKAERLCSVEARGFESNCASSWVGSLEPIQAGELEAETWREGGELDTKDKANGLGRSHTSRRGE
jgi:hypothetical protein